MNYRHLFHAGSFADVFKHIVLIALLQALSKKDKPFCYIDTHAGAGIYKLSLLENTENKEYLSGIEQVIQYYNQNTKDNLDTQPSKTIHPLIEKYLEIIQSYNYPTYYPGSPLIAKTCLDEYALRFKSNENNPDQNKVELQDHVILSELHPNEYQALKDIFRASRSPNISIHLQDGYLAMKAFLPPKERRGLILIDPPYEKSLEWQSILDTLAIGLQKFNSGIYAIWYPIKDKKTVLQFKHDLKNLLNKNHIPSEKALVAELSIYPEDAEFRLIGSGMIIINPPWKIQEELESVSKQLLKILDKEGRGRITISIL